MGMSASFPGCQSLSAVRVKRSTNRIVPEQEQAAPWTTSVFGVSLEDCNQKDGDSIPLVIKDLVEYLYMFGLKHKGLFRISGSVHKVKILKAKYDRGEKVNLDHEGDIDTVASLIKLFLKDLPVGVIPEYTHAGFIGAYNAHRHDTDECNKQLKKLIERLPIAHSNILRYLCTFLIKVASYSEINSMTLENMSIVFGPSFFRIPFSENIHNKQMLCNSILLHILCNYEKISKSEIGSRVRFTLPMFSVF
ncbi:hypothetical protein GDO86_013487 [Hymenochirus boettgeri]|uniref:Rho-GAP domain-containing protein n=1 Tax=Hymenochirus boettgeri TaxID=247094 RepID=A0A8T2IRK9_9PIPI|nr:hypothetical protein GDO86_013487 [Hymenochirus boettgeri]